MLPSGSDRPGHSAKIFSVPQQPYLQRKAMRGSGDQKPPFLTPYRRDAHLYKLFDPPTASSNERGMHFLACGTMGQALED